MSEPQSIWQSWQPWLPLVTTVVGWGIVNWQNNRRELRKEQRAVMDAAKRLAVDIAANAVTYMGQDQRNEVTEAEIKTCLDLLEIELGRLDDYESERQVVRAMGKFSDAVTGGDFESAQRIARSRSDPAVQQIVAARNALMSKLESLFTTRYS